LFIASDRGLGWRSSGNAPARAVRCAQERNEEAMPRGEEKKATSNKPKLTVKEKKAKKKEKGKK
jgi:hypothetical protein